MPFQHLMNIFFEKKVKNILSIQKEVVILQPIYKWRVRISASTQDFHSWKRSSTLLRATKI